MKKIKGDKYNSTKMKDDDLKKLTAILELINEGTEIEWITLFLKTNLYS